MKNVICTSSLVILVLFLLLQKGVYAQTSKVLFVNAKSHQDNNSIANSSVEVPLDRLIFSQHIYHFYIDSLLQKIYLRTREKNQKRTKFKSHGHVGTLDMKTYEFDWQKKINYNKTIPHIKNRYLIRRKGRKDKMFDLLTGQELWEAKTEILYINDKLGVGFGYKKLGWGRDFRQLEGLDLSDGQIIWKREINRRHGLREMFSMNDSTVIISGSGIHSLNVVTGEGWAIAQRSGNEKSVMLIGRKKFYNLGSNIVRDSLDGMMYHAAEEIVKFDSFGNVIWTTELPFEELSKMHMYQDDEFLFILNTGGANEVNAVYGHCGKPFFAKVNKQTGRILFKIYIPMEDKDYVYNIDYISSQKLVALTKNLIIVLNPSTGMTIKRLILDKKKFGKSRRLISYEPYILVNGSLVSLYDDYLFGVYDTKEEVINFVAKNDEYKMIKVDDIYFRHELDKKYHLYFGNDKGSFLSDKESKKLAKLEVLQKPILLNQKLYSYKDKRLHIHDLSKFRFSEN